MKLKTVNSKGRLIYMTEDTFDAELEEFKEILKQIDVHQRGMEILLKNLNKIKKDPSKKELYESRKEIYKHEFIVLAELFGELSRKMDSKRYELKERIQNMRI